MGVSPLYPWVLIFCVYFCKKNYSSVRTQQTNGDDHPFLSFFPFFSVFRNGWYRSTVEATFTPSRRDFVRTVIKVWAIHWCGVSSCMFTSNSDLSGRTLWWHSCFKSIFSCLLWLTKLSFWYLFYVTNLITGRSKWRRMFWKQSSSNAKETTQTTKTRKEEKTLKKCFFACAQFLISLEKTASIRCYSHNLLLIKCCKLNDITDI